MRQLDTGWTLTFKRKRPTTGGGGGGGETPPPETPTITIDSVGPQQPNGDVPLGYTIASDGAYMVVLYPAATAKPLAADFGGANPAYTALGQKTFTAAGTAVQFALPADLLGSFKLALRPPTGGDATVVESASFALDTKDPVASAVSFTSGSAVGDVNYAFTSDENANYRVSLFPAGSSPTETAIKNGTGASFTVTGTATAGVPVSGVIAAVADVSYVTAIHMADAVSNASNMVYGAVTGKSAAVNVNLTSVQAAMGATSYTGGAATFAGMAAGDPAANRLLIFVGAWRNQDPASVTIGGVPASFTFLTPPTTIRGVRTVVAWAVVPSGATVDVVAPGVSGGPSAAYGSLFRATGATVVSSLHASTTDAGVSSQTLVLDQNVNNGDAAIMLAWATPSPDVHPSLQSGFTLQSNFNGTYGIVGYRTNLTAAAPLAIRPTATLSGDDIAGTAVIVRAV